MKKEIKKTSDDVLSFNNYASVEEKPSGLEFTLSFSVPFQDKEVRFARITEEDVFGAYRLVLIEALQLRMQSCVEMLHNNMDRVIRSTSMQVYFKKSNGTVHIFNKPSFEAMQEAVVLLVEEKYNQFTKVQVEQMIKALYWVDKPADIDGVSFGNLISCLMELVMFQEEPEFRYALPK